VVLPARLAAMMRPIRSCHTCSETMSEERFQAGKMCCDKPLFGDDEDEDEWEARKIAGHTCASGSGVPLVAGKVIWGCDYGRDNGCETWYDADCEDKECCEMCSEMKREDDEEDEEAE